MKKNDKVVVGPNDQLRQALITWFHATPEGGYLGKDNTIKKINVVFRWKGMSNQFVKSCKTCYAAKNEMWLI